MKTKILSFLVILFVTRGEKATGTNDTYSTATITDFNANDTNLEEDTTGEDGEDYEPNSILTEDIDGVLVNSINFFRMIERNCSVAYFEVQDENATLQNTKRDEEGCVVVCSSV